MPTSGLIVVKTVSGADDSQPIAEGVYVTPIRGMKLFLSVS